jgi:hypothetical protein
MYALTSPGNVIRPEGGTHEGGTCGANRPPAGGLPPQPAAVPVAEFITAIIDLLDERGVTVDPDDVVMSLAKLSASSLLLALNVNPWLDPADDSREARQIREAQLEHSTRTTTRSRRSL